jgi:hypothetical protein
MNLNIRSWLELAFVCGFIALGIAAFEAWMADGRDRAELNAQLETAKAALSQADARQHDRDAKLEQTLAALATLQRTVQTPAQILRDLPRQIPLPVPLTQQSVSLPAEESLEAPAPGRNVGEPATRVPPNPAKAAGIILPPQDLKPLYDFSLTCNACKARLATAQADLADERTKENVLTQERDQALRIAQGGTIARRMARAGKWLAIGAAGGALAAKLAH